MDCCTIATLRQVASVRVLAESYRRHHPGARVIAVLVDDIWHEIGEGEPFDVLRVDDLDIGANHFHRVALVRDEQGLVDTLKPLLALSALARRSEALVYMDPETLVLGPLGSIREALDEAPVALVPYLDAELPRDNRTPTSHELLLHGAIDLGLIGFSPAAGPLLDWWWDHVALDRRLARGEHPDPDPQFANRIPTLFEHATLRDPGLRVGYWNAFARPIELEGDRYSVEGHPLLTFRFTGFDHRQPWILSAYQGGRPRVLVSEHRAIAQLCETYAAALSAQGADVFADTPYRFSVLPGGPPIDETMRKLALGALAASTTHAGPPDPFDLGKQSAFVRWLREPADPGRLPRYLGELTPEQDAGRLVDWAIGAGRRDEGLPLELIPPPLPLGERRSDAGEAGEAHGPLARAEGWLAEGALTSWESPSPYGALGRMARRALRRVLRPYSVRQREFQLAVVEALRLHEQRLDAIRDYAEILRASLDSLSDRQAADRRDASPKLAATRRAIYGRLGVLAERLDRLDPVLYLADPAAFRTTDGRGRTIMGFETDAPVHMDATLAFTETFRGPESRVRDLQRSYVEGILAGHEPVLDIGCGRGELLDLLREAGVEAWGVEGNPAMVDRSRAKGHRAELAEGVDYLASLPSGSLGAVFAAQVIEHLPDAQLVRLFELARDKLKVGGVLVAETLNPHSVQVLKTFWVDPTHTKPIFPEVALAYCRAAGFASARILFPFGSGDLESDLRTQNEYAVVASVSAGAV